MKNIIGLYKDKVVLITGHMGFKGTWLSALLLELGATVIGYGLKNGVEPCLFYETGLDKELISIEGDIRDYVKLKSVVERYEPDLVFHLAAQPIVLLGYQEPRYTYETNVMGTVNILEAVRTLKKKVSLINVTTDKVYKNTETGVCFTEDTELNGTDPYSNSKSCSELVSNTYREVFFKGKNVIVSTMRAGNVIGGGDFQDNRIIPDCVRAAKTGKILEVRNPNSVRPYQHVLEAIWAYVYVAISQYDDPSLQGSYNVGPEPENELTTSELVTCFCSVWGNGLAWESTVKEGPREANLLRLNTDLIKRMFGLKQLLSVEETIELTAQWYKAYCEGVDARKLMASQIAEYLKKV